MSVQFERLSSVNGDEWGIRMRFRMDGEDFELIPEDVRSRLRGRIPGNIQQHWVEVDGVRWPVKEALRVVTGSKTGFVSTTAQRHFRNLGFLVSREGQPRPAGTRQRRESFDASALPTLESVSASVAFTWRGAGEVTLDAAGLPAFPSLPHEPGLYRFDFTSTDSETKRVLYVGESVDVARRGSNYRNAKTDRSRQRTSRRIHKELLAHLNAGGTVQFAIAIEVKLGVDGESVDLHRKSARRLAENAAVLLAQMDEGVDVLNIDIDLDPAEQENVDS